MTRLNWIPDYGICCAFYAYGSNLWMASSTLSHLIFLVGHTTKKYVLEVLCRAIRGPLVTLHNSIP